MRLIPLVSLHLLPVEVQTLANLMSEACWVSLRPQLSKNPATILGHTETDPGLVQ